MPVIFFLFNLSTFCSRSYGKSFYDHVRISRGVTTILDGSGGRFSKDPVTYRARKVILKTLIRLP